MAFASRAQIERQGIGTRYLKRGVAFAVMKVNGARTGCGEWRGSRLAAVFSAHYPLSSWVHLGSPTLGSGSTSGLGAAGAGMIELVLEKAPDLEMKLDRAAIPSTVPRNQDCRS